MPTKSSIAERFKQLDDRRSGKMRRARECAELTIPSLLPPQGASDDQDLTIPYSSAPARFVSGLASNMTATILPMNDIPFFLYTVAGTPESDEQAQEVSLQLSAWERQIMENLKAGNLRQQFNIVAQHLIAVGDCLLYQRDDFDFQVYRLDQYVVQRDWSGRPYCIIFREFYDVDYLPPVLANIKPVSSDPYSASGSQRQYEAAYTSLELDPKTAKWTSRTEFRGSPVSALNGAYADDVFPYYALRWTAKPGEDYARSLCEENIGDLRQLDALSKAAVEGAAASSWFFLMVNPGGFTELKDVQSVGQGGAIPGRLEDVQCFQVKNVAQLQFTGEAIQILIRNLGRAFLDELTMQPTGERVTAYQISRLGAAMTQALGGPLTNLYQDVQPQIVRRSTFVLEKDGLVSEDVTTLLKDEKLRIKIKTGLEALSRESDRSQMAVLLETFRGLPPEALQPVEWTGFLPELFLSTGVDPRGKLKSKQQMQQESQQAQQAELAQQAGSRAIEAAGTVAEQQATEVPEQ